MKKKGYSTPSLFGGINHYDAGGKKKARVLSSMEAALAYQEKNASTMNVY